MSTPNILSRDKPCPGCGQPAVPEHAPFCSRGCKDRDLLNWLGDAYRVPGRATEEGMEDFDTDGLDSEA